MTIELDSTLAQAEVLFLSFAQLISDLDQRRVEAEHQSQELRRRKGKSEGGDDKDGEEESPKVVVSEYLRELLVVGRDHKLLVV